MFRERFTINGAIEDHGVINHQLQSSVVLALGILIYWRVQSFNSIEQPLSSQGNIDEHEESNSSAQSVSSSELERKKRCSRININFLTQVSPKFSYIQGGAPAFSRMKTNISCENLFQKAKIVFRDQPRGFPRRSR